MDDIFDILDSLDVPIDDIDYIDIDYIDIDYIDVDKWLLEV